jgi:sialidase-1
MRVLTQLHLVILVATGCSYDWDRFQADGAMDASMDSGVDARPDATADAAADASTDADAGIIRDGLVLHLPFDEPGGTVTRDTVTGRDLGTIEGGASFEMGVVANALHFDGADDRVIVDLDAPFSLGARFSLTFFARPDSITDDASFFNCVADPHLLARIDYTDVENLDWVTARPEHGDWPDYAIGTNLDVLTIGEWQHLAFVADDGLLTIYVDGEEVRSGVKMTPPDETELEPVCYVSGAHWSQVDARFHGALDDIRLYDRPLDSAEVSTLAER